MPEIERSTTDGRTKLTVTGEGVGASVVLATSDPTEAERVLSALHAELEAELDQPLAYYLGGGA